jgi:hypothetical protein
MLVLAAQGRIDYRDFVFSNVGDDSEYPETLTYLHEHAIPYAEAHGLTIHVVQRWNSRRQQHETLWDRIMRDGSNSVPIPVYFKPDGMPGGRACTGEFKIEVVKKWILERGATPEDPAHVAIGISLDEFQRMRDSKDAFQVLDYPLIDLRMTRNDCQRVIREAGLPVPPKSSCFFCPFHRLGVWQELYDKHPDLFAKSVLLERTLNERRAARKEDPEWVAKREAAGKKTDIDPVYLTKYGKPLDQVVTGQHREQLSLLDALETQRHNCGPFVCATDNDAA